MVIWDAMTLMWRQYNVVGPPGGPLGLCTPYGEENHVKNKSSLTQRDMAVEHQYNE